ncbi:MAG TPA: hypothetical protein VIH85_00900 [Solirubrobacteraceae bacterium]
MVRVLFAQLGPWQEIEVNVELLEVVLGTADPEDQHACCWPRLQRLPVKTAASKA